MNPETFAQHRARVLADVQEELFSSWHQEYETWAEQFDRSLPPVTGQGPEGQDWEPEVSFPDDEEKP